MDSRHRISGRDDCKNLSYMYDKLIKDYAQRHLTTDDLLYLFPDRNSAMDWENLEDILLNQVYKTSYDTQFSMEISSKKILIKDSSTRECPMIQLADIFAGMMRSSFEDYDVYEQWLNTQQSMIETTKKLTNRERFRFPIYKIINEWAKENKWRISLKSNKGFISYNPVSPLNFWFYKPQHENDKAPVRESVILS